MTTEERMRAEQLLSSLFDRAAAKSIAVINQDDAESEMAEFLLWVKVYPALRPRVVQLFVESFSDTYYLRSQPWKFLSFCMHDLRWPEMHDYIVAKRADDVNERGARASSIWNDILAAFEEDWAHASGFRTFTMGEESMGLK